MRHEAIFINVGKERVIALLVQKEGLFHSETRACVLVEQSINLSFKNTAQFVERNWGKKGTTIKTALNMLRHTQDGKTGGLATLLNPTLLFAFDSKL